MAVVQSHHQRSVVLVGAGHVHLYLAAHAEAMISRKARVVLVDPSTFWYSGMATGMLGGMYTAADDQVDPQALIEANGGEFIRGRVVGMDAGARHLRLASGDELPYDYLSLNVGSRVPMNPWPGAESDASVWPVKPISNLWKLREHLESRFLVGDSSSVAVVGGGPTGTEVAANLLALGAHHRARLHVTLASRSERLIKQAPQGASSDLQQRLVQRGLTLHLNTKIDRREGSTLVTDNGKRIDADLVVLATGLEANGLMQETGLPADAKEGLRVNARLQSIVDERVFAGGDCAAMEGFTLPKLGVFGVRQAACIHANLLACLAGRPLTEYTPQKRYLTILNLGDGTALATWGPFWWSGRSSLWLKDAIDRRFLTRYRTASILKKSE
jgi:NADH dehydrogenase FAD-containing subunit